MKKGKKALIIGIAAVLLIILGVVIALLQKPKKKPELINTEVTIESEKEGSDNPSSVAKDENESESETPESSATEPDSTTPEDSEATDPSETTNTPETTEPPTEPEKPEHVHIWVADHKDATETTVGYDKVYCTGCDEIKEYKPILIVSEKCKAEAQLLFDLINVERTKKGIAPVKQMQALSDAAMIRALEQLSTGCSHSRPDGSQCFTVFDETGLMKNCHTAGENAAYNYESAQEVNDGFQASEEHRINRENPDFEYVGIGCVETPDGLYAYIELFYTPWK